MLPDVRQAIARLVRRGLLELDDAAPRTERWLRFVVPGITAGPTRPPADAPPVA
jgi:hypothetical protein